MIILALDLATQTGWCLLANGSILGSGSQSFAKKRGESNGLLFFRARKWLSDFYPHGIGLVADDKPTFAGTLHPGSYMLCEVMIFADFAKREAKSLPLQGYTSRFAHLVHTEPGEGATKTCPIHRIQCARPCTPRNWKPENLKTKKRRTANDIRLSALEIAKTMPPLRHYSPTEYDIMKSDVATWLISQPAVRQFIVATCALGRTVVFNSDTGICQGSD